MNNTLADLRKFVAPELVFGTGARHMVARYAANFGASRVLIVTDPGVIDAGWTKDATESLKSAGIPFHVFSALTPNPKAEEVMAGAEAYQQEQCDLIVAIGGGSSIDCAKGIGIVSSNRGHILDYEGVDQVPTPGPPLICVPTTGGSAADVTQFAIITDTSRKVKITVISKTLVPDVSLMDPLTLTTMSRELTAHTGMDAIAHAFEAYVSNAGSRITDLLALEGVRLMSSNLVPALMHPGDVALRSSTMLASLYAGMAFSNAGLGLVHAMAHALGGRLDIPHGESNSILISRVLEFNFPAVPERYAQLAEAFGLRVSGLDAAGRHKALLDGLEQMRKTLKVDLSLSAYGVKRDEIGDLAALALRDPCLATNPRRPTQMEIEELYDKTL